MKKQILSSLIFLIFGLFFLVNSFRYQIGTINDTGPGFYPLTISIVLILLSLLQILLVFKNDR